jgi:small-conductance mechanosensitive channel
MNIRDIFTTIRETLGVRLFEIVIVLVSLWASKVVQRVVSGVLIRGGVTREDTLATTRRLLHYAVVIAGLAVALQTVGISLGTVFAAGAVAAVAIGFALQNILQNFVSGVILLAERSITETDVLEVEGTIVRIDKMGARAAVARTREEEELIIPNSILVQSTVRNLTLSDAIYRIRSRVGVAYSSDMREVERVLMDAALSLQGRAADREPAVLLMEFGDSSVVWEVSVWAEDPWSASVTRSDLNKAIWWALADAGITIAFPQVDVHFDPDALVRPGTVAGDTPT